MSILINGTELGNSIALNNTDLSEIVFNGVTVWRSSNLPVWDNRGLDYNSWETIQSYILNGMFSTVASVGDTKSFVMNGKTYHAEVVSINNGTGSAASWYPNNTVDFICTELYETEYRYNSSATNAGGFPSSEIKSTLNDTIYPLLPSDLKAVIIDKSHSYQSGSYSGSSWSSQMTTLATKLWLPTQYEITGTIAESAMGEESSNNKKYILSSLIKIKNGSTSSASEWWLSSPCASNPYTFYYVHSSGVVYASKYATGLGGVPICFRIGVPPKSLENTSWYEIKNDIVNGTFSQYASVGDTKSFVMDGRTYNAEVVAINDGTGSAGQWYPNGTVDFICKELYRRRDWFNQDDENAGGFPDSDLKNILISTIYPLFPSDLKDVIIKKSHSYNTSTSGAMRTIATKLWAPTYYEITGTTEYYDRYQEATRQDDPGENSSNNKKYTLSSLVKAVNGQTSSSHWWLSSISSFSSHVIWAVVSDGRLSDSFSANVSNGIPIGFRIG